MSRRIPRVIHVWGDDLRIPPSHPGAPHTVELLRTENNDRDGTPGTGWIKYAIAPKKKKRKK